jgi:hypothetical protein
MSKIGNLRRAPASIVKAAPAVLRIVPPSRNGSAAVVQALLKLLEGAKCGAITGIAFACQLSPCSGGQDHITDVAGSCFDNPLFARGMLKTLDDEIGLLVHLRSGRS